MAAHPAMASAMMPTTIMREKNLLLAPPVMAACPARRVPQFLRLGPPADHSAVW
jgi:hypothetical protein